MPEFEFVKKRNRFQRLQETLEFAQKQDDEQIEKVKIYDKLFEIFKNNDLDVRQKSEMLIQVLSSVSEEYKK